MRTLRSSLLLPLAIAMGLCASGARTAEPAASPELQRLNALAGQWNVRQSFWSAPDKPPAIDTGTATFTPVLGGRHLRQELHIASGTPFDGLGYLGYDDAGKRYDSLWMDVNFTGIIVAHGGFDAATSTYTFDGQVPDPAHPGQTSPLREVMRVQDADHVVFDYYERHAGQEMLMVRLEYARKGAQGH